MVIIDGKIVGSAEQDDVKIIVNWTHNDDDFWWRPDQEAYAYLASGFRIDFLLAQLGAGFEDLHVDTIKQMAAVMADIAGALHRAIYDVTTEKEEKDNPYEDWPDRGEFWFSR